MGWVFNLVLLEDINALRESPVMSKCPLDQGPPFWLKNHRDKKIRGRSKLFKLLCKPNPEMPAIFAACWNPVAPGRITEQMKSRVQKLWEKIASTLAESTHQPTADIGRRMRTAVTGNYDAPLFFSTLSDFFWESDPADVPRSFKALETLTKLSGVLCNVL